MATLLWGTLKVFRDLDTAFSEIYDTASNSTFLEQLKDSVVVLGALGVAILIVVAAGAVFALLEDRPVVGLISSLLLIGGLAVSFFPVYYVFPDLDLTVREVLAGVVTAAVG